MEKTFLLFVILRTLYSVYCEIQNPHSVISFDEEKRTLSYKEIYIYQFDSTKTNPSFIFTTLKGNPLIYGYYAYDVTDLLIQEEDLMTLSYLELLEKPKNVDKNSFLFLKLTKNNAIEEKSQEIIILFCPDKEGCQINTLYCPDNALFFIEENQKLFIPLVTIKSTPVFFLSDKLSENESTTVTFYINSLNGDIELTVQLGLEYYGKTMVIEPKYSFSDSKEIGTFVINRDEFIEYKNIIMFSFSPSSNPLLSLEIELEKTNEITLHENMAELHELYEGTPISLLIQSSSFTEKVPIVFHLISQNCYVTLEQLENEKDNIIYKGDVIQFTLTDIKDYTMKLSLDHYDHESYSNINDYCTYTTYLFQETNKKEVLINEGSTYLTKFDNNHQMIRYQFSFIPTQNSQVVSLIGNVRFDIDAKITLKTQFEGQGIAGSKTFTLINSDTIILEQNYTKFCAYESICNFLIEIVSLTPEIEYTVHFSIQLNQFPFLFLKKNEIIYGGMLESSLFYHTHCFTGEKLSFEFNSKNVNFGLSVKLFGKQKKSLISENKWKIYGKDSETKKKYSNVLIFNVSNQCINGCDLFIMVSQDDVFYNGGLLQEFTIGVRKDNSPLLAPINELISGNVINKGEEYSYIYTLPRKIKKFQIFMKGNNTEFIVEDLNISNPFSSEYQKSYEPKTESLFVDFTVDVDTTNYNIKIKITVKSLDNDIDDYNTQYSMKVIPNKNLEYPIHYVQGNELVETYTGKEHNKVYLLYKLIYTSISEYFIYVYEEGKETTFNIKYNILTCSSITDKYEGSWSEFFDGTSAEKLFVKGPNYGLFQTKISDVTLAVIVIESPKNDTKINFFISTDKLAAESPSIIVGHPMLLYVNSGKGTSMDYSDTCPDNVYYSYSLDKVYGYGVLNYWDRTINFEQNVQFIVNSTNTKIISAISTNELYNLIFKYDSHMYVNESNHIEILEFNQMRTIYTNYYSFPLRLAFKLKDYKGQFTQNYKIRNIDVNNLNNTELTVNVYFMDSSFKKENDYSTIKTVYFDRTIMIKGYIDDSISNKYDYLYVELTDKVDTPDGNPIAIQILSSIDSKINITSNLFPKKYLYGMLDSKTDSITYNLALSQFSQNVKIEFASCSDDDFSFEFKELENNTQIEPEPLEQIYGRTVIKLNDIKHENIEMTIKRINASSKNDSYYMVKYSTIDSFKQFHLYTLNQNFSSIYTSDNAVESSWGSIYNVSSQKYISSRYHLEFYKQGKEVLPHDKICSMIPSDYRTTDYKNTSRWNNTDNLSFKFETKAVAYFEDPYSEEEYFLMLGTDLVEGGVTYLWLWIVLIFVCLFILIGYGTYLVYKQVKKVAADDEDDYNIEINDGINNYEQPEEEPIEVEE